MIFLKLSTYPCIFFLKSRERCVCFFWGGSTYQDKYTSQSNMHHAIQTILDKIMNAFQAQIQEFPPRLIDNLKIKGKERKKLFCGC